MTRSPERTSRRSTLGTVPSATNSDNLGGSPAADFAKKTDVRADGVVNSADIDNFTTGTYTSILSKAITAPRPASCT